MNRIAITVYVDIPDGLTPDVTYGNTPPVVAATLQTMDEPPLPDAPPPDMMAEAQRIFEVKSSEARAPVCTVHRVDMTYFPAGITKSGPNAGKPRGAFYKCSEKVGDNWCRERRDAA